MMPAASWPQTTGYGRFGKIAIAGRAGRCGRCRWPRPAQAPRLQRAREVERIDLELSRRGRHYRGGNVHMGLPKPWQNPFSLPHLGLGVHSCPVPDVGQLDLCGRRKGRTDLSDM
jgi:hypothetical protein